MTARIAEQLGGTDAHVEERKRQSTWLVEQLELDRLARRLVPGCRLISQ